MNEKYPSLLHIVLVEPEIPQNTGNIGRICVGAQCHLHLVGRLGFDISDRALKRAGLDYWPHLMFTHHPDWETWRRQVVDWNRVFFLTTKVDKPIYDHHFEEGDWFVFGRETRGLDQEIISEFREQALTIPFPGRIRSFNLSNAVSMVVGEGMRQLLYRG